MNETDSAKENEKISSALNRSFKKHLPNRLEVLTRRCKTLASRHFDINLLALTLSDCHEMSIRATQNGMLELAQSLNNLHDLLAGYMDKQSLLTDEDNKILQARCSVLESFLTPTKDEQTSSDAEQELPEESATGASLTMDPMHPWTPFNPGTGHTASQKTEAGKQWLKTAQREPPSPAHAQTDNIKPLKILLLGDDASQSLDVANLVRNAGMSIRILKNKDHLLASLSEFAPEIILIGHLAKTDLTVLTQEIRDVYQSGFMAVLYLSKSSDDEEQMKLLDAGGDGFIEYPMHEGQAIDSLSQTGAMIRKSRLNPDKIKRRGEFLNITQFVESLSEQLNLERTDTQGVMVVDLRQLEQSGSESTLRSLAREDLDAIMKVFWGRLPGEASLSRLGGSGFAALLPYTSRQELEDIATRITQDISLLASSTNLASGAGIGMMEQLPRDPARLIASLKKLATSSSEVRPYDPGQQSSMLANDRNQIEQALRDALESDTLQLHFQALVSSDDSRLEHYQVLLRSPQQVSGRLMSPSHFIQVAVEADIISNLDQWVARQAMDILMQRLQKNKPVQLIVPQDVVTISSPDYSRWLLNQAKLRGLHCPMICIELIAGDYATDKEAIIYNCQQIKDAGFRLSLSHFKADPACQELLTAMKPDYVKLATSITMKTDSNQALNESLAMISDTKCKSIATRVENTRLAADLMQLGVNYILGYAFQSPEPELNYDFKSKAD